MEEHVHSVYNNIMGTVYLGCFLNIAQVMKPELF